MRTYDQFLEETKQASPTRHKKLIHASASLASHTDRIPRHISTRTVKHIQAKLSVNIPGNIYEHEADRAAKQLMQNKSPFAQKPSTVVAQAKGSHEGHESASGWGNRFDLNAGGGNPLPSQSRSFFEARLNYDFSKVRIHADSKAALMSKSLGAHAFTYGRDIYFATGQFNPYSSEGRELLAHELTHVMQQNNELHHFGATSRNVNSSSAHIQRKIALTGDSANTSRVIAVINAGLDIRYQAQLNSSGEIEIVESGNQGPPTREQEYFTQRLRPLINENRTTTVSVSSGGRAIVGSYGTGEIDIADIEALGIGQPGWDARAALLHELVEQREKQLGATPAEREYGTATTGAHGEGLAAEVGMIGATLESDSGLVSATTNPDGTMNGTRTVVFRYPDGTRYRIAVTISHNNITNVTRTRLP